MEVTRTSTHMKLQIEISREHLRVSHRSKLDNVAPTADTFDLEFRRLIGAVGRSNFFRYPQSLTKAIRHNDGLCEVAEV